MSYTYLLDLYSTIDEKMGQIQAQQRTTPPDSEHQYYLNGKYECLKRLRTFLRENFHDKLPRRIQKNLDPPMRTEN